MHSVQPKFNPTKETSHHTWSEARTCRSPSTPISKFMSTPLAPVHVSPTPADRQGHYLHMMQCSAISTQNSFFNIQDLQISLLEQDIVNCQASRCSMREKCFRKHMRLACPPACLPYYGVNPAMDVTAERCDACSRSIGPPNTGNPGYRYLKSW